jgi:hypothetical protein
MATTDAAAARADGVPADERRRASAARIAWFATGDAQTERDRAAAPVPLPAPEAVRAVSGRGQVTVDWEPVEGAAGYLVHRAATADGPFEPIDQHTGDVLAVPHGPYVDTTGAAGAEAWYAVSSVPTVETEGGSLSDRRSTSSHPHLRQRAARPATDRGAPRLRGASRSGGPSGARMRRHFSPSTTRHGARPSWCAAWRRRWVARRRSPTGRSPITSRSSAVRPGSSTVVSACSASATCASRAGGACGCSSSSATRAGVRDRRRRRRRHGAGDRLEGGGRPGGDRGLERDADVTKAGGDPLLHRSASLNVSGLLAARYRLHHRRLDEEHSNLVASWARIGGGADWPDAAQWDELASPRPRSRSSNRSASSFPPAGGSSWTSSCRCHRSRCSS